MKRVWLVLAALAATMLVASPAHAQRRYRNGKVYTADGMAYDVNSPEWRMAGGNIYAYQQIMAQKAAMQQQQRFLKQMQANQKAFEQWKKQNPEAYKKLKEQQEQWMMQVQKANEIPLHYRNTAKKTKMKKTKKSADPAGSGVQKPASAPAQADTAAKAEK